MSNTDPGPVAAMRSMFAASKRSLRVERCSLELRGLAGRVGRLHASS